MYLNEPSFNIYMYMYESRLAHNSTSTSKSDEVTINEQRSSNEWAMKSQEVYLFPLLGFEFNLHNFLHENMDVT